MKNKLTILLFFIAFVLSFLQAAEIVPLSYTFDQSTGTGSYAYHDWTGRQLIDGYYGVAPWSANLGNGNAYEWVGWVSKPTVNIDFDFGSATLINQINVGTVQDDPSDVVIPSIYLYSSNDKSSWSLVTSRNIPESSSYNNSYQTISFSSLSVSSRYIRVSARFSSDGPWTFLDEVDFYQTATPSLSSSNTNFGNVRVGTSSTATVTVTNSGSAGTTLTGNIGAASGSEFSPVSGNQSFSLGQNLSATRTYTYTPSARGADSTTISITSNATNTSRTLSGTGVSPVFSSSVAPGSTIQFGEVGYIGTQTLSVQNLTPDADLGNLTDMTILSATITGPDASYFTLQNFTPGMKLSKSQLQNLAIQFMHNYSGRDEYGYVRNATLTLNTDVGAALGSSGSSYAFALQATTIPEPCTISLILVSALVFLGFSLNKKKI